MKKDLQTTSGDDREPACSIIGSVFTAHTAIQHAIYATASLSIYLSHPFPALNIGL